jgi:hypothetical protein
MHSYAGTRDTPKGYYALPTEQCGNHPSHHHAALRPLGDVLMMGGICHLAINTLATASLIAHPSHHLSSTRPRGCRRHSGCRSRKSTITLST